MALRLNAEIAGQGRPLVILHGLFGSARNWGLVSRRLSDIRRVHALDLRNHGSSPWDAAMDYPSMAADVLAYIEDQTGPCDLLGHSMGGKVAMRAALERSDLIERLIVVDIAPVPYKREFYPAYIEAMQGARLAGIERRSEVEAEIAAGVPDPALRAFLVQNLIRTDAGFAWRLNLDALSANMDDITGWPAIEARYDGPATFLAGERSNYVRPRDEPAIRALFPAARIVEVGNSGHWPHAEQPERFLELVGAALS